MNDWRASAVQHLHRRAGFGASRATRERALRIGRRAALDELLARDDPDEGLDRGLESLLGLGEIEHLQGWWVAHLLADRAPLRERVALLWHDHFATSNDKVDDVRAMHRHVQLLREHGLGDFRELLHALTIDPAMLLWLDGVRNERGVPNENYAREVMELFALGIGHYDERDVAEAARALTGWTVVGRSARFDESRHDPGEKHVFGRGGVHDAHDLVERVLAHPACPRHVARRLLAEFVHPDPTDEAVERWARVLVDVDWTIARFLEQLLASDDFADEGARRSRIAGPVELALYSAIELGGRPAPRAVVRATSAMGQSLCRPPSVKGWDGGRHWIHAGHWLARHEALVALASDEGVDWAECLGTSATDSIPDALLALSLPEIACPALEGELRREAARHTDFDAAARACAALVMTSPEHHLC